MGEMGEPRDQRGAHDEARFSVAANRWTFRDPRDHHTDREPGEGDQFRGQDSVIPTVPTLQNSANGGPTPTVRPPEDSTLAGPGIDPDAGHCPCHHFEPTVLSAR
jgi:hypothetical protein